jgi:hypothetical protein
MMVSQKHGSNLQNAIVVIRNETEHNAEGSDTTQHECSHVILFPEFDLSVNV